MRNVKAEAVLWVQLGLLLSLWVIVLSVTGTKLVINWEAIKKLPDVVTLYLILSLIFTKWLWRLRVFRGWLVPFPDLAGTWEGEIRSTWKDPETDRHTPRIPVILVVRQTFSSIACAVFTKESESYSTAAQFSVDEENGALFLNYNYTNRPKAAIRDRSAIHDGAARLRVITVPTLSLRGEFWTSRCTAGEMSLKYRSKELLESFTMD